MQRQISNYNKLLINIERESKAKISPVIIAIAGPPAVGKSTLAKKIVDDLNTNELTDNIETLENDSKENSDVLNLNEVNLDNNEEIEVEIEMDVEDDEEDAEVLEV